MNPTEANSIRLPVIAAGIYVVALLLITTIGNFGTPDLLPRSAADAPLAEFVGTHFGFAWSIAGNHDFNGDGVLDLVTVALGNEKSDVSAQGVVISGADAKDRKAIILGTWANSAKSASSTIVGDIDGDGLPEIAFGFQELTTGLDLGGVEVASSKSGEVVLSRRGHHRGDMFGFDVCSVGDVNGDKIPDLAIAAPGSQNNNTVGLVYLVSGADGTNIRILKISNRKGNRFGFSLANVGDMNGDGTADLLVGAPGLSTNGYHSGSVFVLSLADGQVLREHEGLEDNYRLGTKVISLTDRDGDGIQDYAIASCSKSHHSHVRVISGASGKKLMTIRSAHGGDSFGLSLCDAGDFDGDGFADIAVGAPFATQEGTDGVGYVRVISGKNGSVLRHIRGSEENEHFGFSLAPAGDQDHNAKQDIFVASSMTAGRSGKISVFGIGHSK